MELFGKDLNSDFVVVAEIGVNHEGDVDAASKLVRLAAEGGADAVKFQTFTPERYASTEDPERLARVRRFALDESAHRRLSGEAKAAGIHFFSTAVTEDVVPFLANLCDVVKIASGDLTFEPVIRAAAGSGKPLILSTGLGTVEEVDRAVAWVSDEVGAERLPERLIVMQCVSAYPAPIEEANVRGMPFLAERYGVAVGYSNHVIGPEACYAAVALGASVVEVHFTDRKDGRTFRDHALSFDPDDLKSFVRTAGGIRRSLGTYEKRRQECESGNLLAVRKGVVAARSLAVGTVLQRDDLMFARPATEFTSEQVSDLIGRRLSRDLSTGELIKRSDLANSSEHS